MSHPECDLEGAWEAARLLLDAAGLRTYLVKVEVDGDEVTIHVEHPRHGAWQLSSLRAPLDELLSTLDDRRRRAALATRMSARIERAAA